MRQFIDPYKICLSALCFLGQAEPQNFLLRAEKRPRSVQNCNKIAQLNKVPFTHLYWLCAKCSLYTHGSRIVLVYVYQSFQRVKSPLNVKNVRLSFEMLPESLVFSQLILLEAIYWPQIFIILMGEKSNQIATHFFFFCPVVKIEWNVSWNARVCRISRFQLFFFSMIYKEEQAATEIQNFNLL